MYCVTCMGKGHPAACRVGPWMRWTCSFTRTLFRRLNGVGGQRNGPTPLLPAKRPDTQCIGEWVGLWTGLNESEINSLPPGSEPLTSQAIASGYTDYAVRTARCYWVSPNKFAKSIGNEKQFTNIFIFSDKCLRLPDRTFKRDTLIQFILLLP